MAFSPRPSDKAVQFNKVFKIIFNSCHLYPCVCRIFILQSIIFVVTNEVDLCRFVVRCSLSVDVNFEFGIWQRCHVYCDVRIDL